MDYEIHVKQLPPQHVVTRRQHTTLGELPSAMHAAIAGIATSVEPPGAARGAPFAIFHDQPFRPDDMDVEFGLPLTPDVKVAPGAGVERVLDAGPVASLVHVGPYEQIGQAYEALYRWLGAHGMSPKGPPCETYLVGPAEATPAEYRTEIDVPVA